MRRRICISRWVLVVLLSSLCSAPVAAAESRLEVQLGRSYMDGHGTSSAFVEGIGVARSMEVPGLNWAPVVSLGWIEGRDSQRYERMRYGARRSTQLLAGGARWQPDRRGAWYGQLYAQFQLAYNRQATQALSSHYQFISSIGWQGRCLSLQLRHVSNGGLHHPNRGETMALAGIGFNL